MIITLHWHHGFPWQYLSIYTNHWSLLAGLPNYILRPHKVDVNKFLLVNKNCHLQPLGSFDEHHLWVLPYIYIYIYIYIYCRFRRMFRQNTFKRLNFKRGKARCIFSKNTITQFNGYFCFGFFVLWHINIRGLFNAKFLWCLRVKVKTRRQKK